MDLFEELKNFIIIKNKFFSRVLWFKLIRLRTISYVLYELFVFISDYSA